MILWHFLDQSFLYNYADGNILSYSHQNPDTLIHTFANKLLFPNHNGSKSTMMKANPTKFQAINLNKKGTRDITLSIMKTLLSFSALRLIIQKHNISITCICDNPARQLTVLRRSATSFIIRQGILVIF